MLNTLLSNYAQIYNS